MPDVVDRKPQRALSSLVFAHLYITAQIEAGASDAPSCIRVSFGSNQIVLHLGAEREGSLALLVGARARLRSLKGEGELCRTLARMLSKLRHTKIASILLGPASRSSASETSPLLSSTARPPTPLPAKQIWVLCLCRFGEPIAFSLVSCS